MNQLRIEMGRAGTLVTPTSDDWEQAWSAFAGEGATGAGIVDHISFAIMRRLEIEAAFTNDRHFSRAGFKTLF